METTNLETAEQQQLAWQNKLDRLEYLILNLSPKLLYHNKQNEDYKRGFARAAFPESSHLRDKILIYDKIQEFCSYYVTEECNLRLMTIFLYEEFTEQDARYFRSFILFSENNNIKAYIEKRFGTDSDGTTFLKYLKKSKVSDFGCFENWYNFYVWLLKNADKSWAKAFLPSIINYR